MSDAGLIACQMQLEHEMCGSSQAAMHMESKGSLTCVTPASSQSIGKADNIWAKHDTGPELARHECCQCPSNKKP